MKHFKTLLREWRGNRTQEEAAEILGAGISSYRNWEQGRHRPPKYSRDRILEFITGEKPKSKD